MRIYIHIYIPLIYMKIMMYGYDHLTRTIWSGSPIDQNGSLTAKSCSSIRQSESISLASLEAKKNIMHSYMSHLMYPI